MSRFNVEDNEKEMKANPVTDEITDIIYSIASTYSLSDARADKAFQDIINLIIKVSEDKELIEALKIYATS